jgi:hypothetical protein
MWPAFRAIVMHCSRSLLVHHNIIPLGPMTLVAPGAGGFISRTMVALGTTIPTCWGGKPRPRTCAGRLDLLTLGPASAVGSAAAEELSAPFAEINRQIADDAPMADSMLVTGRWRYSTSFAATSATWRPW